MAAAVHADANPILFEFTGSHRGSLTDETAQRQLLHRLLIDVLALEAFTLFRVSPRGVVETVDARGYAADSAEELARGVARRGLPSLERSSSVVPAEDLFSVDPARLVGAHRRAPVPGPGVGRGRSHRPGERARQGHVPRA